MAGVDTFVNDLTGFGQGLWNTITHTIEGTLNGDNHKYSTDQDIWEDNTSRQKFKTAVVYGEPFRKAKFIFVPEMNDFYTDEELNDTYHSADDYRNAVARYGFIYKTQRFENADTVEKLFAYAKDWIKNNYHGGIPQFNVTALDMHLADRSDLDKFTSGRRVNVKYKDAASQSYVTRTLTIISAEYDLNNPDKNVYKIGVPDIAFNKVYGDTSKNGGGGGGGGKGSDETDNDTVTDLQSIKDQEDRSKAFLNEKSWAHLITQTATNPDGTISLSDLLTPNARNPVGSFLYGLSADALVTTLLKTYNVNADRAYCDYVNVTGGVDTDMLSSNQSNTGRTNAMSIDVAGQATAIDLKVSKAAEIKEMEAESIEVTKEASMKDLTVTDTAVMKDIDASGTVTVTSFAADDAAVTDMTATNADIGTLLVNGENILDKIPSSTVNVVIDGVSYKLYGEQRSQ